MAKNELPPLCGGFNGHHAAQHSWGWDTFEDNFKINALEASKAYWDSWPGRREWEATHGSR